MCWCSPPRITESIWTGACRPALLGDEDFVTEEEEISINSIPILPAALEVRTHTAATGLVTTRNVGNMSASAP